MPISLEMMPRVLASIALVVAAGLISRWQRLDVEKEIGVATVRAFVQLIAIGFVLNWIFGQQGPFWVILIAMEMVLVAGISAGQRGAGVPYARALAWFAIGVGTLLTLGLLLLLRVFPFEPRYAIPIAGMVVGNSMNVTSLVMARLRDEITGQRATIEAALALGATGREAVMPHLRRALKAAMTPIIDSTRTVGLIQLPGAMVGMILAGASPLEAVQLQIIVMYMLTGAAAFTGVAAAYGTYRQFFTRHHQLVLPDARLAAPTERDWLRNALGRLRASI